MAQAASAAQTIAPTVIFCIEKPPNPTAGRPGGLSGCPSHIGQSDIGVMAIRLICSHGAREILPEGNFPRVSGPSDRGGVWDSGTRYELKRETSVSRGRRELPSS